MSVDILKGNDQIQKGDLIAWRGKDGITDALKQRVGRNELFFVLRTERKVLSEGEDDSLREGVNTKIFTFIYLGVSHLEGNPEVYVQRIGVGEEPFWISISRLQEERDKFCLVPLNARYFTRIASASLFLSTPREVWGS